MQVFDNASMGQLFIGSNQAAVEWKRGDNPLGIHVVIQLEQETFKPGHSRYEMEWHASELAEVDSGALPTAYVAASWDIESMVAEKDAAEFPDFYDDPFDEKNKGHLSIILRACQLLRQGLNVMVQGTSAGSPTYISHGRLVSLFISPRF